MLVDVASTMWPMFYTEHPKFRLFYSVHTKCIMLYTQGAKPGFWVKTGTACCKRFDAKKHIYTYLGTNCTWTTLTDFCWKFVGTI